jgi:methyltransferase (TIGR00027 family)
MAGKSVEQKPSETAMFAALHRAIAHKDYQDDKFGADYLAEYFLPPHFQFFIKFKAIRAKTITDLHKAFPGLHEYMIARTAFFDRVFLRALENQVPQIVLLGAGYDTRAYRYSKVNSTSKIIELDIAPTQNKKRDCLQKARIDIPDRVNLVPIDFNQESIRDVLAKVGYENTKESLFLWEGVTYYLDSGAVAETLEFVSHAIQNSAIAFDYGVTASAETIDQYGVKEFYQSMQKHHQDESVMFTIADGKAEAYLEQRGLEITRHLDNAEIEREYLVKDDGSWIGRVPAHFRLVLASPKSS